MYTHMGSSHRIVCWFVKSQVIRVRFGLWGGPLPGSRTSKCCTGSGAVDPSATALGSFGFFLQHCSTLQKQSGASRNVSTRSD